MAVFEVRIRRSAAKELARLPRVETRRILRRIHALGENPRPPGSEKLAGQESYRIRQGDYRVIYTVDDDLVIVEIARVGHRRGVYRN